jgi:hypothetical protein
VLIERGLFNLADEQSKAGINIPYTAGILNLILPVTYASKKAVTVFPGRKPQVNIILRLGNDCL